MSQNGLDIVGHLIDRLGSDFRPYLTTILASAVDRLGKASTSILNKFFKLEVNACRLTNLVKSLEASYLDRKTIIKIKRAIVTKLPLFEALTQI